MEIENISLERLQEINEEREQTLIDPEFQSWMNEFNIGKLHLNREGIIRANQLMEDWNIQLLNKNY